MSRFSLCPVDFLLTLLDLIKQDCIVACECVVPLVQDFVVRIVKEERLFSEVVECIKILNREMANALNPVHNICELSLKISSLGVCVNSHQLQDRLASF